VAAQALSKITWLAKESNCQRIATENR